MRILVDGDVYGWQNCGGISRIYNALLPRWSVRDSSVIVDLAVKRHAETARLPAEVRRHMRWVPQVSPAWRPWRLWQVAAPPLNRCLERHFWRQSQGDVFLSTYYTCPDVAAPRICVVYDMIVELFPDSFEAWYTREIPLRKQRAVETAAVVICISEQTRRDVVRWLKVPEGKCRVIHLAGEIALADERHPHTDPKPVRPFFLYVGDHVRPYKNFGILAECLLSGAFVRFTDIDLVVVSPYPPGPELPVKFHAALANGRIHFVRQCDDAVLADLYQRCAAFICPSLYEGFGIPVLEALGAGAPVACSSAASLPEVGGTVVQYFDPRSPGELAAALERALNEGRSSDAVARRQTHAATFTWDKTAAGFLEVFREVCGK